jgi:hypothetical protein
MRALGWLEKPSALWPPWSLPPLPPQVTFRTQALHAQHLHSAVHKKAVERAADEALAAQRRSV